MLRSAKPKSRAYIWYGEQGQGVDLFHERLERQLEEDLNRTTVVVKRPEWPVAPEVRLHQNFADRLKETFQVNHLEQIPDQLRREVHGVSGQKTLLYVRHIPVPMGGVMTLPIYKRYLEWWDGVFVPLLRAGQFALLGVSFVVDDPVRFRQEALALELNRLPLTHTRFRLLDELERLAEEDLLEFLASHNVKLPAGREVPIVQRILEKTKGHYERTIDELKSEIAAAW